MGRVSVCVRRGPLITLGVQRMATLLLVTLLVALGHAVTIVPLTEQVPVTTTLRPCSWAYFSLALPGSSTSFAAGSYSLTVVSSLGSGPLTVYHTISATVGDAQIPTFLSTNAECNPDCVSEPIECTGINGYAIFGVYSGRTDEITFNFTAGAITSYALNGPTAVTNNVLLPILMHTTDTYRFQFTKPAGITNGFLRVYLAAPAGNATQSFYLTHGAPMPQACGKLPLLHTFASGDLTDDPTAFAEISPCEWLGDPTKTYYEFGLVALNDRGYIPITINASVYYAHTPQTAPGAFTLANYQDVAYHEVAFPVGTQELDVIITNTMLLQNAYSPATSLVLGDNSTVGLAGSYSSDPAFSPVPSGCDTTMATLDCSPHMACRFRVRACDYPSNTLYVNLNLKGGVSPNSFQNFPASYSLMTVASTGTPTALTPNTLTPSSIPFGQTYQYFTVAVTDADVVDFSRLVVTAFFEGHVANSYFLPMGMTILMSQYGLPGLGDNSIDDCDTYQRICNSEAMCTVDIDFCFLQPGTTWYIAVAMTTPSSIGTRWVPQDARFTIRASFEAPIVLHNDTLTDGAVAPNANIGVRYKFTIHPEDLSAVSELFIAAAVMFTTGDTLNYYVQRGSPAGIANLCQTRLETRTGPFFPYTTSDSSNHANPTTGHDLAGSGVFDNTGIVTIQCPLVPGDYYISVYAANFNEVAVPFTIYARLQAVFGANVHALVANTPMAGDGATGDAFFFDASAVPEGAALRFHVAVTGLSSHSDGETYVPSITMGVVNGTELCTNAPRFMSMSCDTHTQVFRPYSSSTSSSPQLYQYYMSRNDAVGVGAHACSVLIPAPAVNGTSYSVYLTNSLGWDTVPVEVTVFVETPAATPLADGVSFAGEVPQVPTANTLLQHFSYAVPADLAATEYIEIEVYPGFGGGDAYVAPLTVFPALNNLAGPPPYYAQWPRAESEESSFAASSTRLYSQSNSHYDDYTDHTTNSQSAPGMAGYERHRSLRSRSTMTMTFMSCELPAGSTIYIAVGQQAFGPVLIDGAPIPFTITARRRSPIALNLNETVTTVTSIVRSFRRGSFAHFKTTLPAALPMNARLRIHFVNSPGIAGQRLFVTNDVDRPGTLAGPNPWTFSKYLESDFDLQVRAFSALGCVTTAPEWASITCGTDLDQSCYITLTGADVHAGATYYIAVSSHVASPDNAPAGQLTVQIDAPAITTITAQAPDATLTFTAGDIPMQGHLDYIVPVLSPAVLDDHYRIILRTQSTVAGAVIYASTGGMPTTTDYDVYCYADKYGSNYECTAEIDNCGAASAIYLSAYVRHDTSLPTPTVVPVDIAVVRVSTISLTNTPVEVTVFHNLETSPAHSMRNHQFGIDHRFWPYAHFKYSTVGMTPLTSASLTLNVDNSVDYFISYSGPAGEQVGGRCVSSDVASSYASGVHTISLFNNMYGSGCTNYEGAVFYVAVRPAEGVANANVSVVAWINITSTVVKNDMTASGVTVAANQGLLFTSSVNTYLAYGTVVEFSILPSSTVTSYYVSVWRNVTACRGTITCQYYSGDAYVSNWDYYPSYEHVAFGGQETVLGATGAGATNLYAFITDIGFFGTPTISTALNTYVPALLTAGSTNTMNLAAGQVRTFYMAGSAVAPGQLLFFDFGHTGSASFGWTSAYYSSATTVGGNFTYSDGMTAAGNPAFDGCTRPSNVYGNYYLVVSATALTTVVVTPRLVTPTPLTAPGSGTFGVYTLAPGIYQMSFDIPAGTKPQFTFTHGNATYSYRVLDAAAGYCPTGAWSTVAGSNVTFDYFQQGNYCPVSAAYTVIVQLALTSGSVIEIYAHYPAPTPLTPGTPLPVVIPAAATGLMFNFAASPALNRLFQVYITEADIPHAVFTVATQMDRPPDTTTTTCGSHLQTGTLASGSGSNRYDVKNVCGAAPSQYYVYVGFTGPQSVDTAFTINIIQMYQDVVTPGVPFTPTQPLLNLRYHLLEITAPSRASAFQELTLSVTGDACGTITVTPYTDAPPYRNSGCSDDAFTLFTLTPSSAATEYSYDFGPKKANYFTGRKFFIDIHATDSFVNQSTSYTVTAQWNAPDPIPVALDEVVTVPEDVNTVYVVDVGPGLEGFVLQIITGDVHLYFDDFGSSSSITSSSVDPIVSYSSRVLPRTPPRLYLAASNAGPMGRFVVRRQSNNDENFLADEYNELQQSVAPISMRYPRATYPNVVYEDSIGPGNSLYFGVARSTNSTMAALRLHLRAFVPASYGLVPHLVQVQLLQLVTGPIHFQEGNCLFITPTDYQRCDMEMVVLLSEIPDEQFLVNVHMAISYMVDVEFSYNVVSFPVDPALANITVLPALTPTSPVAIQDNTYLNAGRLYQFDVPALPAASTFRALLTNSDCCATFFDQTGDQVNLLHSDAVTVLDLPTPNTVYLFVDCSGGTTLSTPQYFSVEVSMHAYTNIVPLTNGVPSSVGGLPETASIDRGSDAYYYPEASSRPDRYFSLSIPPNTAYVDVGVAFSAMDARSSYAEIEYQVAFNRVPGQVYHDNSFSGPVRFDFPPAGTMYITVRLTDFASSAVSALSVTATAAPLIVTPLALGTAVTGRTSSVFLPDASAVNDYRTAYTVANTGGCLSLTIYCRNCAYYLLGSGEFLGYTPSPSSPLANPYVVADVATQPINTVDYEGSIYIIVASTATLASEETFVLSVAAKPANYPTLSLNTPTALTFAVNADLMFMLDPGATASSTSTFSVTFSSGGLHDFEYLFYDANMTALHNDFFTCGEGPFYVQFLRCDGPTNRANATVLVTVSLITPIALSSNVATTVTAQPGSTLLFSVPRSLASIVTLTPTPGNGTAVDLTLSWISNACYPNMWVRRTDFARTSGATYPSCPAEEGAPCYATRVLEGATDTSPGDELLLVQVGFPMRIQAYDNTLGTGAGTYGPPIYYSFDVKAAIGLDVAPATTSEFCGDVGTAVIQGSNDTLRSHSARAWFENFYRSIACQPVGTVGSGEINLCMPLTTACNQSIALLSCELHYADVNPSGFVLDPCSNFCSDVMTNCFPFTTLGRYQQGFQVVNGPIDPQSDTNLQFGAGWCLDSGEYMCSGRVVAPIVDTPPPPPETAAVVTNSNVGLIVGLTLGLLFFFIIVAVVAVVIIRKRAGGGSSSSKPMSSKPAATTTVKTVSSTPAPAPTPTPAPTPAPVATAPPPTTAPAPTTVNLDAVFDV